MWKRLTFSSAQRLRYAQWVIVFLVGVNYLGGLLALALRRDASRFVTFGLQLLYGTLCLQSYRWVRGGQITRGALLLLGVEGAQNLIGQCRGDGLGVQYGLSVLMIGAVIASQLLPKRWMSWGIWTSVGLGVAVVVLDVFVPDIAQTPVQAAQILFIVNASVGVLAMLCGLAVALPFNDYPLSTPFTLTFLAVILLSIGLIVVASLSTSTARLTRDVGERLHNAGLATLANASFPAAATVTSVQPDMEQLNRPWHPAVSSNHLNDPLGRSRLNSPAALQLQEYRALFPSIVEFIITDPFGSLASASTLTANYYFGGHDWWLAAYNDERAQPTLAGPLTMTTPPRKR